MLFDHLFTLVLVLVLPAWVAWDVPRLARRIAADPVHARTKDYLWGIAIQWGVTLALIAAWSWAGRPLRDVGLRLPDTASAWSWSLLITGAGIVLFGQQALSVLRSPDAQARVRKQIESQPGVRTVLPSTPREARVFGVVAVTAGICEEILYRGYLLWYLQAFVPRGAAVVAAVVAFGAGHAYQGLRGIFATGSAGAVAMAVYLLTGSLLAPIVLHAALDLVNGLTIYRSFREEGTPAPEG
ncbi:MAG TPA: CPBP family intramembrane glutamic endopeptidase [Vicinamibacterales bacterium]|nr:CPBP family intramembrane glutamic endopeptidase [Vicinamibacterales bacterium]